MKFKMNDREWEIKEVEQSEMWEEAKEKQGSGEYFFGKTMFPEQQIWLDKDMSKEQKKRTLIHELLHCYRGMYVSFCPFDNCDEDFWCDIMSNSYEMIKEIVDKYFDR